MGYGKIVRSSAVFLLLGAIVTFAVAWGFSLVWVPRVSQHIGSHYGNGWSAGAYRSLGRLNVLSSWVNRDGSVVHPSKSSELMKELPQWLHFRTDIPSHVTNAVYHVSVVEATGWPLLSLWCECGYAGYVAGGISLPIPNRYWSKDGMSAALPLQPIWPGFAINTIFYAGVLWMVFALPFVMRRYFWGRRIKRGLCPACAYPVGASPVCTECGHPRQPARNQAATT